MSGKSPAESLATMTELVLPTHANAVGSLFGGQVLAWVDLCAAIAAQRHTGQIVLTAGIDELSFERPIKVGQVVRVTAKPTAAFRTSLELLVVVEGEDARSGETWPCVTAFVTFVAIGDDGRPAPVPPLALASDEERALAADALVRRERRLAQRKRPSPR